MPELHALLRFWSRLAGLALVVIMALTGVIAPAAAAPPANDNFANAFTMTSLPALINATNVDSTYEPDEPSAGTLNNGTTVWWRFTPTQSGRYLVNAVSGSFNPVADVYTGSVLGSLQSVFPSGRTFNATAGTTYSIRIRGHLLGEGSFSLRVLGPSPTNDDFANAVTINGFGTATGTNVGASYEPGEASGAGNTVWWRFTPTASGPVTVNTYGSNFNTVLQVYTGNSTTALTSIAFSNDTNGLQSEVAFNAVAGVVYRIQVGGSLYAQGNVAVTVARGDTAGAANVVAAVAPAARATVAGDFVTIFATMVNSAASVATGCFPQPPPGWPGAFGYFPYNFATGQLSPRGSPANIPAGARQDFLLEFKPATATTSNLALVFDCTNTNPAPSIQGVNTFLLTSVQGTPPADVLAVMATTTNDGIMNVPLNGTGFASMAARNIGAAATLQLRLSNAPIGGSAPALPVTIKMCRTNPATSVCTTPQLSPPWIFSAAANQTVTFAAFLTSNGSPIPFDPATRRLYVHFYQDNTAVGAASVAVRTVSNPDAHTASR